MVADEGKFQLPPDAQERQRQRHAAEGTTILPPRGLKTRDYVGPPQLISAVEAQYAERTVRLRVCPTQSTARGDPTSLAKEE